MSNDNIVIIDPTSTRRTVYGSMVQAAASLGLPIPYEDNETVNEIYNVLAKQYPEPKEYPKINAFMFGLGGCYTTVTPVGEETTPYAHEPWDGSPFYTMPLVLRRKDNDLTEEERKDYYLRVENYEVNNVQYIAYMAKALDTSDTAIKRYVTTPSASGDKREVFIPNSDTLQPTPKKPNLSAGNIVSGKYMEVECIVKLGFKAWQIDELLNVKRLLTGTSTLDVNEVAILQSVPRIIKVQQGSNSVDFVEAAAVQPVAYFSNKIPVNSYAGSDYTGRFNLGISDPLALSIAES